MMKLYELCGMAKPPCGLGVLLIGFLCLIPFLDKAYHIDDTLFLAAADQILINPFHPYAFHINWFGEPTSMWVATQNPPLASYLLGLFQVMGLTTEPLLHLAFLPFTLIAIYLCFRLAKEWDVDGNWVAWGTLAAPAFFVSSTNLMADIPFLCLFLGAILGWIRGIKTSSYLAWILSSFCVAGAVMTK
jgi:hypothetical protein